MNIALQLLSCMTYTDENQRFFVITVGFFEEQNYL